jgi:hypothetical protein
MRNFQTNIDRLAGLDSMSKFNVANGFKPLNNKYLWNCIVSFYFSSATFLD